MSKVLIVVVELEGSQFETLEIYDLSNQDLQRARSYIKDQNTLDFCRDILCLSDAEIDNVPYRFIEAHIDQRVETLL